MVRIKKDILCPECNNLLGVSDNANTGGTKYCTQCKKTVIYSIKNNKVITRLK